MRHLLLAGIVLGPLFYVVVIAQMLTRTGFDFTRQPMSLLALGEGGWVQTANFWLAGILGIVFAIGLLGLGRGLPVIIAAILLLVFGIGIIIAGIFPSDPSMGFPPGAPEGVPETMSRNAQLHGLGFMVSFTALMLAIAAFGIMFWASSIPLALASFIVALLIPVIIGIGMSRMDWASVAFFVAGALSFGWLTLVATLLWRSN